MSETIFIGRCDCDSHVKFPFHWAEVIREEAEKLELDVIDLQREDYIEEKTKKHIKANNPFFVFLNGHGNEWCSMGYKRNPVLIANKNDFLLKDRIAYVLSCNTAQYLGQVAYDKGCKAYIGYEDIFTFVYINEENPFDDNVAKIFMDASNKIPLTILNRGTPKESFEESQKMFDKWINFWWKKWRGKEKTKLPPELIGDILAALITDKEGQRLFCDITSS